MKMNLSFGSFLLLVLALFVNPSCEKEAKTDSPESSSISLADASSAKLESKLLKSLRSATSRYNSTTQAEKAGYLETDECVAVPGLGGMGYHWVNETLVDPEFNPLEPEVMLYAKAPNGKLRLVAVEYIVINVGQPRPSIDGHLFDIGGTPVPVPHWSLHVWLYEENPTGIFEPWNPVISCQ